MGMREIRVTDDQGLTDGTAKGSEVANVFHEVICAYTVVSVALNGAGAGVVGNDRRGCWTGTFLVSWRPGTVHEDDSVEVLELRLRLEAAHTRAFRLHWDEKLREHEIFELRWFGLFGNLRGG